MTKSISVEVVSDFACPWCYIGKRRLEGAIMRCSALDIKVIWQPFQLNPDMPREGRDRAKYYQEKFGEERTRQLLANIKIVGAEEGIDITIKPGAIAPNVLAAHSLMLLARDDEAIDQSMLAEKLFHAHHVECENIGDPDVLIRIAGELDMDTDAVEANLVTRELEPVVTALVQESYARGVTGVPFYIINGRHSISGAQSTASFVAGFDQIAAADIASS